MSWDTSYTFQHKTISIADRLHPMVVTSSLWGQMAQIQVLATPYYKLCDFKQII